MSCPPLLRHYLVLLTGRPLTRPGRYYAALGVSHHEWPTHGELRSKFLKSEAGHLRDVRIVGVQEISAKDMAELGDE